MSRPETAPPLPGDRYVSTTEVARTLGVSVTTVKRWVDGGVLSARRTPGGHRKVLLADVARLARDGSYPTPHPAVAADHAVRFHSAVTAADAGAIRAVLRDAFAAGVPAGDLADRVVAPALAFVGREWAAGRLSIGTEHLITQAVVAAVYELTGRVQAAAGPGRPVAVGGAPEQDHFLLPTLLARLTLLEAGWEAIDLGPHTPMAVLRAAVETFGPRLVWVCVSELPDPDGFVAEYRELYRTADSRGVAVAVGGRALTQEVRTRIPYTTYGDGLAQLGAFARALGPRG